MKRQRVERSATDMLKAFEFKLYSMKAANADSTNASEEVIADSDLDDEEWELLARKQVRDADGFMTEYSLYKSSNGRIVTVFGDSDLYGPEDEDFDMEFDSIEEAEDWFDNYQSEDEEDW